MKNSIKLEKVYYYLVDGSSELLAIRPLIDFDDSFIMWTEGGQEHLIWFRQFNTNFSNWESFSNNPPQEISFENEDGHHIIFKELTLDMYNALLEPKLHLGLNFKNDADVQRYFLDSVKRH